MRKSLAERLVDEYKALVMALHQRECSVRLEGNVIAIGSKRYGARMEAKYFRYYFVRHARECADVTHEWWRPNRIDEVCRACGAIRRDDRRNGVCPAYAI